MNDIAVEVKNLTKRFDTPLQSGSIKQLVTSAFRGKSDADKPYTAIQDVSFSVNNGEFFGIVGRNGSGKSTLLKMIAGIYTPSEGGVGVKGRLVPFIELGVGFNPELSGKDNVFLNGALLGFTRKEMQAMYDDIVEFAELDGHMETKLKNFSSGMQVRLAFSIAIRAKADVLLIDEVLAVGDAAFQRKCFDYFEMLKKDKKTVIFVTHDMSAVQRFCDRVLVIKDSKSLGIFKPDEAKAEYFGITDESVDGNAKTKTRELRWGTGEIKVGSISVIDKDGSKLKSVATRQDIRIKLPIKNVSLDAKDKIVVGVSIFSENGENIVGPNTAHLQLTADTKEAILTIKNPNINEGRYTVSTAIFNPSYSKLYDHFEKGSSFRISGSEKAFGVVLLESEWKVQ